MWLARSYERKGKPRLPLLLLGSFVLRLPLAIYHVFSWPESFGPDLNPILMTLLEPYLDYDHYYQLFAKAFVLESWVPYSEMADHPWLNSYLYPPLFLYIISIPALISPDLVFLPLFLADVVLPVLTYWFLRAQSENVALWGYLVTVCNPLLIFYDGGMFFNTSLVLLVLIACLYFLYGERYKIAICTLALAFLFKQVIVFLFPPMVSYAVLKTSSSSKKSGLKQLVVFGTILGGTLSVGSLPWLLMSPEKYISTLFMGQTPSLEPDLRPRHLTWPLHWYSFLIDLRVPTEIIYVVGFLNFTMLGLLFVELIVVVMLIRWYRAGMLDWLRLLDVVVWVAILSHLFLPRGVYKYYFTLHVVLIILWVAFHHQASLETSHGHKRWFRMVISLSLLVLIFPRQLYLLLIWLIFFLLIWTDFKTHAMLAGNTGKESNTDINHTA